jgi:bifunctional DNase/RNase
MRGREFAVTTATEVDDVEMRIAKAVGLAGARHEAGHEAGHEVFQYVVLEEVAGDRQLAIEIGWAEALSLAARLEGKEWPRPMTYQFVAALVQALGGRVRQVRIDRLVGGAYAATVEVEGPPGVQSVDARSSDALNLAALVQTPVFVAPEVLVEAETRRAGDSPGAVRLRQALVAAPMTFGSP